jgi:hypothetical protein
MRVKVALQRFELFAVLEADDVVLKHRPFWIDRWLLGGPLRLDRLPFASDEFTL